MSNRNIFKITHRIGTYARMYTRQMSSTPTCNFPEYNKMAKKLHLPKAPSEGSNWSHNYHCKKLDQLLYCRRVQFQDGENTKPGVAFLCGNWSLKPKAVRDKFMYSLNEITKEDSNSSCPRKVANQLNDACKYLDTINASEKL